MSPARRVAVATATFAIVLSVLGALKYASYHAGSDLGLFTQAIATGGVAMRGAIEGASHYVVHFSPLLAFCAPALLASRTPLALVVVQAVACALVAPPVFRFARRRLPPAVAAECAVLALLYPPLVGVAFADFHENGFVPALTAWLLDAVDAGRLRVAAVCVAALLCTKEDQAPILAFAAIVGAIAFRRDDRARARFCIGALLASVATFAGFYAIVRPLAGARDAWLPLHFYAWNRPVEAGAVSAHPALARASYLLEAFAPLLFAPLRSPYVVLALPGFAELLASHEAITYTMGQHYAAVWIGAVLVAEAAALAAIARARPERARLLLRASIALCALQLLVASPTHWARTVALPSAHDRAVDRFLATLPANLAVGTQEELFAHLGYDARASLGLRSDPPYALLDLTRPASYYVARDLPRLRADLRAGRARELPSAPGLLFVRRQSAPPREKTR